MTDNYYNQGQDFQDDRLTYSQRNPSMGNFEEQQRFAPPQTQQRNQTDRISPTRQVPNMMQAPPQNLVAQQQMGLPQQQVAPRQMPVAAAQQQQYAQPPPI